MQLPLKFDLISSDSTNLVAAIAVVLLLIFVVVFVVVHVISTRRRFSQQRETKQPPKQSQQEVNSNNSTFQDVWAERQARGITTTSTATSALSSSKKSTGDKPFGSKYYYAHNNPNAKGGYKDGLRMEDYTMNGPRLLSSSTSRNSSFSSDDDMKNNNSLLRSGSEQLGATAAAATTRSVDTTSTQPQQQQRRVIAVTRYLWDDPGTGIATIRIEQLPHVDNTGKMIDLKDAGIQQVAASLIDANDRTNNSSVGLLVVLECSAAAVEYRLHIARLFGDVSKVSTSVFKPNSSKRVLIKLEKKTTLFDKSNAKAWPHPHKKVQ